MDRQAMRRSEFGEFVEETGAVDLVDEDRLAVVAALDQVVRESRRGQARQPSHLGSPEVRERKFDSDPDFVT
jgi:hypothetical protein